MTYIIAEAGSVPDGSAGSAVRLMQECHAAGADAFKLQCHTGEKVKGDPPWFKGWELRGDYLKRTEFSLANWRFIREHAILLGIDLIVSPFSVEAVALLEELPVDAYKIASGQVTNLAMLAHVAHTGRPVYLSSGMSDEGEVEEAWEALHPNAHTTPGPITLMQCTSSYPCPPESVGLNVLQEWRRARTSPSMYCQRIGLSDHTLGFAASLAAITLGATVIERHVCFDRRGYGTDCAHSLTLDEFARFVRDVRELDVMLANPVDKDTLCQTSEIQKMRNCFLERP